MLFPTACLISFLCIMSVCLRDMGFVFGVDLVIVASCLHSIS